MQTDNTVGPSKRAEDKVVDRFIFLKHFYLDLLAEFGYK